MTQLLPEQIETLRELSVLWRDTPFVLIGANALALQVDLEWRQTNDLDLVVSVPLDSYPAGLATLRGWERHPEGEHAWRSPAGIKVDVVPAGPALLRVGSLTWPTSGFQMNLAGLRLAFERNVRVALDSHTSVQVATTPVIVILKIVAFLDRPAARHDDLGDIAQVFDRYLGPTEDRRWGLPTDFENASAFALGEDVGSVINEDELAIVSRFLDLSRDENDGHRTHALLIRNGPWEWRERPEVLFDRLNAFENGLGRRS